jgi:hypothetical protein
MTFSSEEIKIKAEHWGGAEGVYIHIEQQSVSMLARDGGGGGGGGGGVWG